MSEERWLFILDVDRIQEYIFDTNRLKTIIGASWLLDHINASDSGATLKLLEKYGMNRSSANFIYSAGGNTKVVFPSEDKAKKFETEIIKKYKAYGISVTTLIYQLETDLQTDSDRFAEATRIIAQKKYNKDLSINEAATPYFKLCELCGKRYVEETVSQRRELVCSVCSSKFDHSTEKPRHFPNVEFKTNMNEIDAQRNMVALVTMDGNNIADKIRALGKNGNDFLSQLKSFSSRTEEIFKEAMEEYLMENFKEDFDNGKISSIRPIIMGGDDICLIIDSKHALKFIREFTKKVEAKSQKTDQDRQLFTDGGITLSTGALFIKRNYPFNFAYRIADSLLHSAKATSRKNGNRSMVDFHVLLSSSGEMIEKTREREYYYEDADKLNLILTKKPYQLNELESLKNDVEKLKNCLARGKIKYLRQALRMGRKDSMMEILKIFRSMEGSRRKDLQEIIEGHVWVWEEDHWRTGLLDLIELTEFTGG